MLKCRPAFSVFSVVGVPVAFAQQDRDSLSSMTGGFMGLDKGQQNMILSAVGLSDPSAFSAGKIIAWIIFGMVGFVAFVYGKKQKNFKPLLIGIALMAYPYFVSSAVWLYVVGMGLSALLFLWRE